MGREVRRVPKDWKHPLKDEAESTSYQPMYDEDFETAMDKWYAEWKAYVPADHDGVPFWEYHGSPPDRPITVRNGAMPSAPT